MKRTILIYNFKDDSTQAVNSVNEAADCTGVAVREIYKQLKEPGSRVHYLKDMLKKGALPTGQIEIIRKTYTYEFSYVSEFVVRVWSAMYYDGAIVRIEDYKDFYSYKDAAKFLECSIQALYNRKNNLALVNKPFRAGSGYSYFLEFAGCPFDKEATKVIPSSIDETSRLFFIRVAKTGEDGVTEYINKVSNNLRNLYNSAKKLCPKEAHFDMSFEEFYALISVLECAPDDKVEMFQEDKFAWTDAITSKPSAHPYAMVMAYDHLGFGTEMYGNGVILVRVA